MYPKKHLLLLVTLVPLCALGQGQLDDEDGSFQYDPRYGKEWKESSTGLPPYPDDSNLLSFAKSDTGIEYLADKTSVAPGKKDNIVRLVIVARSPSNARTVFYEGYHCGTKRYKRYAVAGAHGPLMPLDKTDWQVIIDAPGGQFRKDLMDHILCTQAYTAASKKKIIDRLKNQSYLTDSFDE